MTQPPGRPPIDHGATRDVVVVAFASFLLIGWTGLLIPSLFLQVQGAFGQSDAGMGLAYLLGSLLYVTGTVASGTLVRRVPRPLLLGAGPALIAAGLLVEAAAPVWLVFLAGYLAVNVGSGIVDAGVNALGMDLFPGRASMLNRIHLFFALGAFASPLTVGALVGGGVPWPAVLVGTALVAAPLAVALATRSLPRAHAVPRSSGGAGRAAGSAGTTTHADRGLARRLPLPLLLLAIAIACYVASELGVSNWLVRYLDGAPLEVATLTLSLFWLSIGLGRLVSSFVTDRIGMVLFATACAAASGAAILAAIVVPSLPLVVVLFAVAGIAAGPVYPTIMAIGGALYPGRATGVSTILASAAIMGSLVYPPLMGVVSESAGIWWSMLGAALFGFGAAAAIATAARAARAARAPAVTGDQANAKA